MDKNAPPAKRESMKRAAGSFIYITALENARAIHLSYYFGTNEKTLSRNHPRPKPATCHSLEKKIVLFELHRFLSWKIPFSIFNTYLKSFNASVDSIFACTTSDSSVSDVQGKCGRGILMYPCFTRSDEQKYIEM